MMKKPLLPRRNDDDYDWSLLLYDDKVVVVVNAITTVNIGTTRRVAASRAYASYSKEMMTSDAPPATARFGMETNPKETRYSSY